MFPTQVCFQKTQWKTISHHASLREMMGQTYLIYACTGSNHASYSIGSLYILRLAGSKGFQSRKKQEK